MSYQPGAPPTAQQQQQQQHLQQRAGASKPNASAAPFVPGTQGGAAIRPASDGAPRPQPAQPISKRKLPVGCCVRVRDTVADPWMPGVVVAHNKERGNAPIVQTTDPQTNPPQCFSGEYEHLLSGYLSSRNEWEFVEPIPSKEVWTAQQSDGNVRNFVRERRDFGHGVYGADQCSMCGKYGKELAQSGSRLRPCPCREVLYCNQVCQRSHWVVHKYVCIYGDKQKHQAQNKKQAAEQAKGKKSEAGQGEKSASAERPAVPSGPLEASEARRRLENLYKKHKPSLLVHVETTLQRFAGKEAEMLAMTVKQIGPEPTNTEVALVEACPIAGAAVAAIACVAWQGWHDKLVAYRKLLDSQWEQAKLQNYEQAALLQKQEPSAQAAAQALEFAPGMTVRAMETIKKAHEARRAAAVTPTVPQQPPAAPPPQPQTQYTHAVGCCCICVCGINRSVLLCQADQRLWRLPFVLASTAEPLASAAVRAVKCDAEGRAIPGLAQVDFIFRGVIAVQQTNDGGLLFICAITPGPQGLQPCPSFAHGLLQWMSIDTLLEVPPNELLPPLRQLRDVGPLPAWLHTIPTEGIEGGTGPVPDPPGLVASPPPAPGAQPAYNGLAWLSAPQRPRIPKQSCLKVQWTPTARAAAEAAESQERRRDPTESDPAQQHREYTHSQFIEFYGKEEGERLWEVAGQMAQMGAAGVRIDPRLQQARRKKKF
eukprot:TRINITY_DN6651_c0_g1_i1.p1 TRINITY_DN6651_c0_g1~~TRINITY_DN6651_c0_g1_i1.p1  ORF type:complete len:813 (+),score=260.83 TRINITY_DN6651_c0_g1_i1:314-2440(+)